MSTGFATDFRKTRGDSLYSAVDVTRLRAGVRANYGISDRSTVDFTLPFQLVQIEEIGMDEFALADIELGLHYRVLSGRSKVWLGATMALPTGESESLADTGELVHGSLQIGRGAPDLILSVKSFSGINERWSVYSGIISRWGLSANSSDYRYGAVVDTTLGCLYSLGKFDAFGQVLWEWTAVDTRSGEDAHDTGGHALYFTPGVRCWVTDNSALTAKTRFLLAEDVVGEQMLPRTMVSFGITRTFN